MLPLVCFAFLPEVLREAEVISVLEDVLNEFVMRFVERFSHHNGWSRMS